MTMNDRVDYIENSKDLKKEIARLRALKAYRNSLKIVNAYSVA